MREREESAPIDTPGSDPQLAVAWSGEWENLRAAWEALWTRLPLLPPQVALEAFRDAAVQRHWPARALVASLLLHVAFIVMPLPAFLTRPHAPPANVEMPRIVYDLHWAGTSRVLPPISPSPTPRPKPSPGGQENQPLPPRGADRVQAQTIVSNPPNPNHPTQTLIKDFSLENARVQAAALRLPNMVIPPSTSTASEIDLRRLRVPNAPVDLSGPPQTPVPPRPRAGSDIALETAAVTNPLARLTVAPQAPAAGSAAPEVNVPLGPARSGDLEAPGLVSLSADPSVPAPVMQLPEGELRARFTAGPFPGQGSPGGVPGGVPGSSGGSGGGPGGEGGGPGGPGGLVIPGITVTPAGPVPPGPVIVGLQAGGGAAAPPPPPKPAVTAKTPATAPAKTPSGQSAEERAEELMEGIAPGTYPSGGNVRRVYTIYINMPNLTSQTGSWVLRFAELGSESSAAPGGAAGFPLEAPVPVKKVDPPYPAEARRNGVEGSVYLYGIIRPDGSVDSVHVVRGMEDAVDHSAVLAFQRWRFEPGRKNGVPVPLEVVVEIPFRLTKLF